MNRTSYCLGLVALLLLSNPHHGWADPIAYYSFDTNYNDSVGTNHGSLIDSGTIGNSGITHTAGEFKFGGGALNISADRDYVALTSLITLASGPGNGWSIAFWSKDANAINNQDGMVIGNRDNTSSFIWMDTQGGGYPRIRSATGTNAYPGSGPETTDWVHSVVVAEGSDLSLYRNGSFVETVTGGAGTGGFEVNTIGEAYTSNFNYDFNGQIDEVYIYNEAISAAEVAALYAGGGIVDDTTPPTLSSIQDDRSGGPVAPNSLVTYTVTFSEDMDEATVTAADFELVGTATYTLGSISESQPGVFQVPVTPTSNGTLQLQITQDAELTDAAGNFLDTSASLQDDTVISVESDTTAPTLAGSQIEDDQGGGPVNIGAQVTFTLTFSEDLDEATLATDDFVNSGTAAVTIDSVIESSPGVVTLTVTPTSTGTLRIAVASGPTITDAAGIALDTMAAITDDTEIQAQVGFTDSGVQTLKVVLVAGQSNADGRAAPGDLPTSPVNLQLPQDDVDFYRKVENQSATLTTLRPGLSETGSFGLAITLGRSLADELADGIHTRIAVIKYANGGTKLNSQWAGGGDATASGDGPEYTIFKETVTNGLATLAATYPNATMEYIGMVWMQGESDVGDTSYETRLTALIGDVRATFHSDLPFVICRLSDGQTALNAAGLEVVRTAQTNVADADPLNALVDTDGFGMKTDNLHFDAVGQQQMGNAAAFELLNFQPFQAPPALSVQAGGNVNISIDDVFTGYRYDLEASSALGPAADWTPVESVTASGNLIEFSYTPESGETSKFFQILRAKP